MTKCEYCEREFGPESEASWCDSSCFNLWFNRKHYGPQVHEQSVEVVDADKVESI